MRSLSVLVALLLSGCAIKNHDYGTSLAGAPESDANQMATIYVARPSVYGFAIKFPMEVNAEAAPALKSGRYVRVEVPAGPVEIKAKGEKVCRVSFEAAADQAYYFVGRVKSGWFYARVQLEAVDSTEGKDAISRCTIAAE